MSIEGFRLGEMGHSFFRMAEWKVRGSNVPGVMHGCGRCGLVLIADRRGTLLVAPGGMGSMHKRIFPCQRPPKCTPIGADPKASLREIQSGLAARHDPRLNVFAPT